MKKILLAIALYSVSVLSSLAQAQQTPTFHFESDTVRAVTQGTPASPIPGEVNIYNKIINNTTEDWKYEWQIIDLNLPQGWQLYGICDNIECRPPNHPSLNTPFLPDTANNISVGLPGQEGLIYAWVTAPENAANGVGYITLKITSLTDVPYSDTAVFILTKEPTSIAQYKSNTSAIKIYPNPVKNSIAEIWIDKNLKARKISLYNIIGQQVVAYPVKQEYTLLKMNNLPSGMYMIRVTDNAGKVIATKKITKN